VDVGWSRWRLVSRRIDRLPALPRPSRRDPIVGEPRAKRAVTRSRRGLFDLCFGHVPRLRGDHASSPIVALVRHKRRRAAWR